MASDFQLKDDLSVFFRLICDLTTSNDIAADRMDVQTLFTQIIEQPIFSYTSVELFVNLLFSLQFVLERQIEDPEKRIAFVDVFSSMYQQLSISNFRTYQRQYGSMAQITHLVDEISANLSQSRLMDLPFESILKNMSAIGIHSSFLYTFKQPINHPHDTVFLKPDSLLLRAYTIENQSFGVPKNEQLVTINSIFNNTNLYNGLSFTTEHNQGRKSERAWAELREISDEICAEHGISVISEPEKGHGVSHFERNMQKEGKSWKDKLRVRIAEVMLYSRDFKDFLEKCSECSIEYVYKPSNKVKLKFRLSGDGQQKFTRADTLGADFTPERIAEQIAEIQEKLSAANVTPDMLIEAPKPVVPKTEPKPTQTVTAPTKPKQSAEPETITETSETAKRKAAAEQVEKFFAARRARRQAQLDMLNATAINPKPEPSARTPQPTPTESKAPEKKEDPWKAIRGMGRANEIIADLEAGGVMSFSELSGFFFNTPHSDDHTTELADLRKKFTAIDTLIDKMKHRDELEPVYKEYQGKSGWSQSRFKKKNAATIEDYEQTVKYIKEHIKKYAVDGKPPTMLDLLEKSNKLKSKWNRLNVEHTAFLTKRETAKKYTRQVRQYINEQQMKREREKSRQRTQAKHRNKNTLE